MLFFLLQIMFAVVMGFSNFFSQVRSYSLEIKILTLIFQTTSSHVLLQRRPLLGLPRPLRPSRQTKRLPQKTSQEKHQPRPTPISSPMRPRPRRHRQNIHFRQSQKNQRPRR